MAPSNEPIGKRLLKLFGWREGHGVGPRRGRKRKQDAKAAPTQPEPKRYGCALPPGGETPPKAIQIHIA